MALVGSIDIAHFEGIAFDRAADVENAFALYAEAMVTFNQVRITQMPSVSSASVTVALQGGRYQRKT